MFQFFKTAERDALAPLLELARAKAGPERATFLADLRVDAPTVVARIEKLLAEEVVMPSEAVERHRDNLPAQRVPDTFFSPSPQFAASARFFG